eukprot:1124338-Pelagomonas_calceolata.AAC.18
MKAAPLDGAHKHEASEGGLHVQMKKAVSGFPSAIFPQAHWLSLLPRRCKCSLLTTTHFSTVHLTLHSTQPLLKE